MNVEAIDPSVEKICREWGWHTPIAEVRRQAEIVNENKGKSLQELLVSLGYLDRDILNNYLAEKEDMNRRDVSLMEFLSRKEGRIRENRQSIYCIQAGVPYYSSLQSEHLQLHPDMEDEEVRVACERHECVLIQIQESEGMIVFPDFDISLRRFGQIAGIEASNDILKTEYGDLVEAVAPRAQVLQMLTASKTPHKGDLFESEGEGANAMGMIFGDRLRDHMTLRRLANIHEAALELQASDIHIDPDSDQKVHLTHRVMGDMVPLPEVLSIQEYHEIKQYLLRKAGATIKFERMVEPKDGMYQYVGRASQAYVRCSFIPLGHSSSGNEDLISICLRLIPLEHGKVDLLQKGVHPDVVEFIKYAVTPDAGIVLLVGPTGSGKSTTVSGTIGLHEDIHGTKKTRMSIEDPVERFLPNIVQFQIPYHLRGKGSGFSLILRNILRHDPNLVWVGEIRDAETAEISVQAASTGHLLVSTIHADSVTKAVERLSNMVPPDRADLRSALIENLSLLVCQRLVKKLCTNCRVETSPTDEQLKYVEYLNRQREMDLRLPDRVYEPNKSGCSRCSNGISGRVPVNEVLQITQKVKSIYLSDDKVGKFEQIQKSVNIRMEDAIMDLIKQGVTPVESLEF